MAEQDNSGKLQFWREQDGSGQLRVGDWGPPKPRLQNGLLFRRPADGSGKLVFGYTVNPGSGTAAPGATLTGHAEFAADLRTRGAIRVGIRVAGHAQFADDLRVRGRLRYDSNVDRGLLARATPTWQNAQPLAAAMRSAWQDSRPLTRAARTAWQSAQPAAPSTRIAWQASQPLSRSARSHWQRAQPATAAFRAAFQEAITRRTGVRQLWQRGQPLSTLERLAFEETLKLHTGARSHWQPARPRTSWWALHNLPAKPAHTAWQLHYQEFARLYYDGRTAPPVEPERELCYCPDTLGQLVFRAPYTGSGKLLFVCRPCPRDPGEPEIPDGDVVVRARRTYVVINRIDIRRADDGTPLRAEAFAMQLDSASWTWSFSASFAWDARDALMPDGGGPVHLVATVNGVDYRFVAEQVSRSVRFPTRLVNVRGRGRAAMLDAPYAQTQTWAPSEQISAQQLMDSVLTVGGVGFGWSLRFELTDWLIPGGAWAHQGTYISALNDIAGAVGGYLQPHATDQELLVLPTWPLPWWRWDEVTPNISLPNGVAELEETEWREQPDYNRVFVHGMSGGIIGQVTREGSAGDKAMPTAVHALITATAAARQRGQHELGRSGTAIRQRLVMPVLPETGIIVPGKYVKYNDGYTDRLGISRAVSVDWSWPALTQTVELEGHE